MIVELDKNNLELISKLENTFPHYFFNNSIIKDFEQNIFTKYFIYIEKSNIISYINYYDLYDRYEISYIEVKEEYRNKKIGSKMLEYLIETGSKNNIINITLEVNMNNENAIKLYEKFNFVKVAIREKYYNGIDGYLMERKMM